MDPKKITGCSQPYDIEELVVPLWDADISNIHKFFGKAGEMIGRYCLFSCIISKIAGLKIRDCHWYTLTTNFCQD